MRPAEAREIRIGLSSCGIASGGERVRDALRAEARAAGFEGLVKTVGCNGMCHREPIVQVVGADGAVTFYGQVTDEAARALSLWVGLERHAPASRFERPADPTLAVMVAPVPELEALCEVDAICRRPLPASRRPPGTAPTIGYAAGPAVTAALGDAVHERMSRDGR